MTVTHKIQSLFVPKRGIWEGALFGFLLGWMHSSWGVMHYLFDWDLWPGSCNMFYIGYLIIALGLLPDTQGWIVEGMTIVILAAIYFGVWKLLRGRLFWLGFVILLLTLSLLAIPTEVPNI